ncbi:MAG: N-formylglutamate amidohydrolase [Sandaracinus sp.]|nr:N-formylglutamate amidohydrolase [Sandaracinus sp.]
MADDPVTHRPGDGALLLTCEHASATLPSGWRWGTSDARLHGTHWTYDPGALELTHELADSLRCAAVASSFTRLLADPNRDADDPGVFRTHAEGLPVELNARLTPEDRRRRLEGYWHRYHDAVDREAARSAAPVLFSVHTFTPVYEGHVRPMEIGVLFDREDALAEELATDLRAEGFVVAMNEPYSGKEGLIYAADRHARAHGKRALEIELRQDLAVRPEARARVVSAMRRFVRRF